MRTNNVNVIHVSLPVGVLVSLEKLAKERNMPLQQLMSEVLRQCAQEHLGLKAENKSKAEAESS